MITAPARADAEVHSADVTLLPGRLIEVVSPANRPGGGLILRRLMRSISTPLAFIDGCDSLDPASIDKAVRQRLLWVRCHQVREAIRAADLLLRDGNLSALLLDLRQVPTKDLLHLPSSIWHRLRMLAERTNVSLAVFSPGPVIPCVAKRWLLRPNLHLADLETSAQDLCLRVNAQLQRGRGLPSAQSPALVSV